MPNGPDLTRFGLISRVLELDLPGGEIDDWKFVQFATDHGALLFDLPAQALDESEMPRAVECFRQLGEELEEYELLDAPGGKPTSTGRSFQVNIANDAEAAARLTVRVFEAVYRVPACVATPISCGLRG